jgi:hypothetical protein
MIEEQKSRPPLIVRSPFAFVNLLYGPCAASGAMLGAYLAAFIAGDWRPDSLVAGIGLTFGAATCGLPIIFIGLRQERAWRELNPPSKRSTRR